MSYKKVLSFAREMRKNPTPAEAFFWDKVRKRRFLGLKFLRQYIIQHSDVLGKKGYYIPDFYCHEKRLIIELDGKIHDFQVEYDQLREGHLQEMGYRVIRFRNEEILKAWEQSALRLEEYIDSL